MEVLGFQQVGSPRGDLDPKWTQQIGATAWSETNPRVPYLVSSPTGNPRAPPWKEIGATALAPDFCPGLDCPHEGQSGATPIANGYFAKGNSLRIGMIGASPKRTSFGASPKRTSSSFFCPTSCDWREEVPRLPFSTQCKPGELPSAYCYDSEKLTYELDPQAKDVHHFAHATLNRWGISKPI